MIGEPPESRCIRVGIDARCLGQEKTGIGIYLSEIVKAWLKQERKEQLALFSHQPIICPVDESVSSYVADKKRGLPWFLLESHRLIRSTPLDLFWGVQGLLPLGLAKSIPTVITVHDCVQLKGSQFAPSRTYHWLHRTLLPLALRRARKILVPSQSTASELTRFYKVPQEKIEVTLLGVNEAFYSSPAEPALIERVLNKYGIRPPYVLAVGALEPRKNLIALLRAFQMLPTDLLNGVQLVLAGKPGWHFEGIRSEISRCMKIFNLRETGYVDRDDMPMLFGAALLFVFPSFYEGFGLPVLEAMASGCPVISSNAASLPEVVGEAGILIAPEANAASWAEAISSVLRDPDYQKELSRRGSAQARKFSWTTCLEKTLAVLRTSSQKE